MRELRTERLLLRGWRASDRAPFAALNADPQVMRWLPAPLSRAVSFTAVGNARSRAVMERLGMTRDPAGDFDHPALPVGHALRRHVLYRRSRAR